MPGPLKPCDGRFSDDLQEVLTRNRNREQWAIHTCQVCGAAVGAQVVHGKWVPEQHWPTMKYPPRNAPTARHERSARPNEGAVSSLSAATMGDGVISSRTP